MKLSSSSSLFLPSNQLWPCPVPSPSLAPCFQPLLSHSTSLLFLFPSQSQLLILSSCQPLTCRCQSVPSGFQVPIPLGLQTQLFTSWMQPLSSRVLPMCLISKPYSQLSSSSCSLVTFDSWSVFLSSFSFSFVLLQPQSPPRSAEVKNPCTGIKLPVIMQHVSPPFSSYFFF